MRARLAELKVLLAADPKKAGVLGLLLVVLLVFGIKAVIPLGPKSTTAAITASTNAETVAAAGQDAYSRTVASIESVRGGGIVRVARPARLDRDLFELDNEYFPLPAQPESVTVPVQDSRVTPVESTAPSVDEVRARAESGVRSEAERLRLRSVIVGSHPIAVFEVKGDRQRAVVRVGESVGGFVLVEVFSDSVVMEKDSVRVRVSLAKPDR